MTKQLLQKLKDAYQVCHNCGITYGISRAGASTMWKDTCDVCGQEAVVTEARDYGYLTKGIKELTPQKKRC